jgi:hypothetical protein
MFAGPRLAPRAGSFPKSGRKKVRPIDSLQLWHRTKVVSEAFMLASGISLKVPLYADLVRAPSHQEIRRSGDQELKPL